MDLFIEHWMSFAFFVAKKGRDKFFISLQGVRTTLEMLLAHEVNNYRLEVFEKQISRNDKSGEDDSNGRYQYSTLVF